MTKNARIYLRVSSDSQDLERQEGIVHAAREAGYYVAGVYREKASGARADRPELLRMIDDLQLGDIVIAEKMDRISRLPLPEAEHLISTIQSKGAILAVPGVVDLSDIMADAEGVSKIVLNAVQDLLLKLSLQMARDDHTTRKERQRQGVQRAKAEKKYTGRKADDERNSLIVTLRQRHSIKETAVLAKCSVSQVKRIWKMHQEACLPEISVMGKRAAGRQR